MIVTLNTLPDFAQTVKKALHPSSIVFLKGETGAGKTTFMKSLIASIAAHPQNVTSPTFNLIQPYDVLIDNIKTTLIHGDFYRLESAEELCSLGLDDYIDNSILCFEWADKFINHLPAPDMTLEFSVIDAELLYKNPVYFSEI